MSPLSIISEAAGHPVNLDDDLNSIGDSMDLIYMVNKIEIATGKQIPDAVLVGFVTFGDLAEWMGA